MQKTEEKTRILIYGLDKFEKYPKDFCPVENQTYQMEFEKFDTISRFQDYDIVILLKSTFEKFKDCSIHRR